MGFGVLGLRFGVWDLGFGAETSGCRDWGLGCRGWDFGFLGVGSGAVEREERGGERHGGLVGLESGIRGQEYVVGARDCIQGLILQISSIKLALCGGVACLLI